MDTRILHVPSGKIYENRKEAKHHMGHNNFNRALRDRKMLFMSTYSTADVII